MINSTLGDLTREDWISSDPERQQMISSTLRRLGFQGIRLNELEEEKSRQLPIRAMKVYIGEEYLTVIRPGFFYSRRLPAAVLPELRLALLLHALWKEQGITTEEEPPELRRFYLDAMQ